MHLRKPRIPYLAFAAIALAWFLGAHAIAEERGTGAKALPLMRQTNTGGDVTVQVTPQNLSANAETWRFNVQLDTHVKPLDQDMRVAASLSDSDGHEEAASAWEGDAAGGHHRKGVLIFKAFSPLPHSITLKIRGVGSIAERSFLWTLAGP